MDEHSDAVKAQLAAHPQMSDDLVDGLVTVYDGPRKLSEPVRQPPYVVFYIYLDNENPTKLNYIKTDESYFTIDTHFAGESRAAVQGGRKYVRDQLLDWIPVISGWKCFRTSHESGDEPDWDDTTGIILLDARDQWRYRAREL